MSIMDEGVAAKMPNNAYLPGRFQTHIRNQPSNSSLLNHDAMAPVEPIPSPRRWSPTYQPRRRSRQFPTLSFVPTPNDPRLDPHEHSNSLSLPRRPAERGPSCISPFRSVRRMKEPFQLMLPSSPASCDSAPTFPPHKSARESKLPGGHSLRTWRSDQNLNSANMAALGLLPSPPMSESRPASTGPESTYFKAPRALSKKEADAEEEMEETRREIARSNLVDESEAASEVLAQQPVSPEAAPEVQEKSKPAVTNVQEAHSNLIRHCDNELQSSPKVGKKNTSGNTSPTSNPSPRRHVPGNSPRPQRPRTATVSSEASWLSSNLAYCETWLKGVPLDPQIEKNQNIKEHNRRKIQIVEQDPPMPKLDLNSGVKTLDAPVRFAVASKPKLVDIAPHSSPSLAPSLPPAPSTNSHPLPMTPDQRQEEVSAFSPDTPLDMSDSGYGTRESGYSLSSYPESKDEDSYSDPGSLTSDSVTSTVVYERPDTAQGERAKSPQPEIRSGSVSPQVSSPAKDSAGRRSPTSEKAESEKSKLLDHGWTPDDHEWTLDELDHFVKDFPRNMLRLTSPVILFLRKSDEKDFLRPFRTIFPEVSENILDGLCAALIARNYLLSLSTLHRHKTTVPTRSDYALDAIPTKAYSTLGIQIPMSSPGRTKDRALSSRSNDLRREVEKIVDNLLFAIRGRSDDTLKSAVEVLAQVLEVNAS